MKSIPITLWGLCYLAVCGYAVQADASLSLFKSERSPYAELCLRIAGQSVQFEPVAGTDRSQASVEVILYFKHQEQILRYDKFALHSPIVPRPADFVDVKRYTLPPQAQTLTIELRDLRRPDAPATVLELPIELPAAEGPCVLQSDIQLLAMARPDSSACAFCKNGFFMEPLTQRTYGKHASTLLFYHEVYDTDVWPGDDFLLSYRIELMEASAKPTGLIAHKRRPPAQVQPFLLQMDISTLPDGEYRLVVEIRNRLQELLSMRSVTFRRENPFLRMNALDLSQVNLDEEFVATLSADELRTSLRALTPKLPGKAQEALNALIKSDSLQAQRRYLFSYWASQHPNAPEMAYRRYMKVVEAVDQAFISGFRRGFETDRGYIYLKYGAPDDVETREQEPSAPPYEIWSYYQFPATSQNNVKFIFYNPSLAPGDYVLLHSEAIGERQNPQWIRELYRHAPAEWDSNPIDGNDILDNFNRNAKRVLRDN